MNKTLVIGANGQIGKLLIQMMSEQQLPVKVMLRSAEQAAEFETMGAEVIIADLEADLPDAAFADCDKVVFTAGSGSKTGADKTILWIYGVPAKQLIKPNNIISSNLLWSVRVMPVSRSMAAKLSSITISANISLTNTLSKAMCLIPFCVLAD